MTMDAGRARRTSRRRGWVAAIVAGVILVAAGVYWFGPQHLFLDERLDEALPSAAEAHDSGGTDPAEAEAEAGTGTGTEGEANADPETVATGSFVSIEHETTGTVSIVELEDGTRFVRFEDLDTLSGPDLRVYLSEAPAGGSPDALDDAFVDLGGLKANQGNQNYRIPSGVDLERFRSVSIWCRRFSVGFGVAPLEA